MKPRPRQILFRDRCLHALADRGNTIGVACVGFGKTIALSAVAAEYPRSLILQHRIELLDQNRAKFQLVAPSAVTATFAAGHKRWAPDGHTFAMMQTVSTAANLLRMEPVDLLVIDEAHHAEAPGYQRIVARARELNPEVHILGVTATPERGDGKSLRSIFDNVADIVTMKEMIEVGFLVRPLGYNMEIAGMAEQIGSLKKGSQDYNMDAAAMLLDVEPVTERVVEEWMKLAHDRRTIGFATNVAHSKHMTEAFRLAGVSVEHVDGTTNSGERKAIWRRLKSGETQMVWNCAVATEGFDEQSVSCIILARPAIHRSTVIQMAGRGMRIITDPAEYPGVFKSDCIILDFGSSLATHGSLEVEGDIDGQLGKGGDAPMKDCPACNTTIPAGCRTCPICGHAFISEDKEGRTLIGDFVMTEVDLLALSPFRWEHLFEGAVVIAEALSASVVLVEFSGTWFAYGIVRGAPKVEMLARTHDKAMAIAKGSEFLKTRGDKDHAKKTKRWLSEPISDKQADLLQVPRHFGPVFTQPLMNRYHACCLLTWKFNEEKLKKSILAQAA